MEENSLKELWWDYKRKPWKTNKTLPETQALFEAVKFQDREGRKVVQPNGISVMWTETKHIQPLSGDLEAPNRENMQRK
jgi:hypothetical protein